MTECTLYFGYTLDVPYFTLPSEKRDLFDDIVYENMENEYGLSGKYFDKVEHTWKIDEGSITLVVDGMSGSYAKLIYILGCQEDVGYIDGFNNKVNKILNDIKVPKEIAQKLKDIGMKMFGKLESADVKTEIIVHWH
jgi:hypothetical protein